MKQLQQGVLQLSEQGATPPFQPWRNKDLLLGVVSVLQFDVAAHRHKGEYGVQAVVDAVGVQTACWVQCDGEKEPKRFKEKAFENLAEHGGGKLVDLAPTRVSLNLTIDCWPDVRFLAT